MPFKIHLGSDCEYSTVEENKLELSIKRCLFFFMFGEIFFILVTELGKLSQCLLLCLLDHLKIPFKVLQSQVSSLWLRMIEFSQNTQSWQVGISQMPKEISLFN